MRRLLSDDDSSLRIHSLVTARLEDCNILYHGLPKKLTKKLQRIQNIAARIQTRTPSYNHVSHILCSLHWLPLRARVKLLITTFKAIHGKAPEYVSITFNRTSRHIHCGRKNKDYWWNLLIFVYRRSDGDLSSMPHLTLGISCQFP